MVMPTTFSQWSELPGRHIVSLSGGKDSTALAIYLRDHIPQLEYVFCDTHKELKETYEYLDRLEAYLQRPIIRLNPDRGFDHWLTMYNGMLPSGQVRWCTRKLKIEPFEAYVGNDKVWSYIGIRGDENRSGYISTKSNIQALYPFKDHGLGLRDVERILAESGLGMPTYYEWRQRSGCYFCFFQRTGEWVGLKDRHPDLYEESKKYETENGGERFTWRQRESLVELEQPERLAQVRADHIKRLEEERRRRPGITLYELNKVVFDEEDDDPGCNICALH
ncbi:phosphoadenosine phosphosulfate reductase family protein [Herpetosiphon giganteus]|uniref:phosphoadenosine phosphosulfate reductase family protein n=1 Tax=Herpetosiphon giganteus TaxID=2029754 RepID=UPI00195E60FF|nr:phosphoadenosine phosphosulfate reductase family protein [Herpetosiphon giganteus]MBM7842188.1 3'-phosphoadenosine 5'-phosphosulfate sulfotransferase (PAPS reductase)/FAD synthetase [Herpetosiphon giganteus]